MALFTDGPISSIDDLTARDSQLPNVASVEGIDVTQKLALAQGELGMDLLGSFNRFSSADQLFWLAPQSALDQIVVTPPLKLWHTARALELVYSDAYNSQLNDRYASKRDQFHALATRTHDKLIELGVGIASLPVPRAATPSVTLFPGALADEVYYITTTWVNARAEEGAPAPEQTISTSSSTFLVGPVKSPQTAAGWNVYVGLAPETMYRQNTSILALGTTWEQPPAVALAGLSPGDGQKPTYFQALPRVIQRG